MFQKAQVSSNVTNVIFNGRNSCYGDKVIVVYRGSKLSKVSEPSRIPESVEKSRGRPPGSKNKLKEDIIKQIEAEDKCTRKRVYEVKTVFSYPMIITMAILNSPEERATVQMMYDFAEHHFPSISLNSSWRNTLRNALSHTYGFQKLFQSSDPQLYYGTCSNPFLWNMIPSLRDGLIRAVIAKANEYRGNPSALMMKDHNELPAILPGYHPPVVRVFRFSRKQTVEPRPARLDEFNEVLKNMKVRRELNVNHVEPTHSNGYWLYYAPQAVYDMPTNG